MSSDVTAPLCSVVGVGAGGPSQRCVAASISTFVPKAVNKPFSHYVPANGLILTADCQNAGWQSERVEALADPADWMMIAAGLIDD